MPTQSLERATREAHRAFGQALRSSIMIRARRGDVREQRTVLLPHPFSNMTREDWVTGIRLWRSSGLPLLREQPPRPCPVCRTGDAAPMFESFDGYPYVECTECGTWYVPLRVDHALFERYFAICPEARRHGDYTLSQVFDPAAEHADQLRFAEN